MPDSSGAYVNEAYAYMNAQQPENALDPFEKAIETGDEDPDTYRFLAQLYQTNDRMEDAVTLLETASTMYPENVDIQTELLNAYQMTGQVDKALDRYKSAVERDPSNALFPVQLWFTAYPRLVTMEMPSPSLTRRLPSIRTIAQRTTQHWCRSHLIRDR